ncbi:MAG: sugar ABC transporter ATP-binding protein [Desulfopila sp.]
MEEHILEMRNIVKTFPGVKAVDNVTFKVRPATVHALVGENGAGKSTLMKILAGEHVADSGEIYFAGRKVEIRTTQDAFDVGISTVYQELNLVPELTIAENMFLGREPQKSWFIDDRYIYQEAEKYLASVRLPYPPQTKLGMLSVAAQQMVEIAKGINRGSKLIVLDEPTSAITDSEVETLFKLVNELKEKGITFIYISHKMDEIFSLCDDVTVMRDGTHVETRSIEGLDKDGLVALMVGRELKDLFPKEEVPIGEEVFRVENLTMKGLFADVSFTVKRGEILGVSGLMGAGRTEISRAIFGLDLITGGKMFLDGEPFMPKSPRDAIESGVAYVPEDRKLHGLCLERPILENISLPNLDMFSRMLGLIDLSLEKQAGEEISKRLKTKAHTLSVNVGTLSGGNQQKVVLSKWLLRDLKVLILDEPTRGIDVGAKSEIYKLMGELALNGVAIIMISSELPEILGMSDRVLVMSEGKLTGELDRMEANQERIMHFATGGPNE